MMSHLCVTHSTDEGGCFFFADKLVSMAKYYGFDGWFFNIECGLDSPANAQRMAAFVGYMRQAIKRELGDNALVIWYDSVTSEGILKYVTLPLTTQRACARALTHCNAQLAQVAKPIEREERDVPRCQ
jgi:endo-beta-N-acetylglucosaminidase D